MNRVWTYVISRELNGNELNQLIESGKIFVNSWTAHDTKLSASFEVFKNRIIVVKVNESIHNASGCSIDKLARFIKESETKFSVELLNRFQIAYQKSNEVEVVHSSKIKELLEQKKITEESIIYNTSVANENDFANWEQPLKYTWLNKYLNKA